MIKIGIFEDDNDDANLLIDLLKKYQDSLKNNEVFDVSRKENCLEILDNYNENFDIIFFDIDMPYMNGMEAAKKIFSFDKEVMIVFVTNLEQYAIQGYQVNALGYLLKPLNFQHLSEIMDKCLRKYSKMISSKRVIQLKGKNAIRIQNNDILYIEVIGHNMTYHTLYGNYQVRKKLTDEENNFISFGFAKCNRGCLVNLYHVKKIEKNTVLVGEDILPISRGQQKIFMNDFLKYLSEENS